MSRMTPPFLTLSRWPSRHFVLCLAFHAILGFAQSTSTTLSANDSQIHYLPSVGQRNNGHPNGWSIMKSGNSVIAFTTSSSANASFTFFGNSIQVFTTAPPSGTVVGNASITLDGESTVSAPPYADGMLFNATFQSAAIPRTIVISKTQQSSGNSVLLISAISVTVLSNIISTSSSESLPLATMSVQSFPTTSSALSHGLSNGVIAAIAVIVALAVLLIVALLLLLRRRRRRLTHQVDPLVIGPPERAQTPRRRQPLPHIRTRTPHYRAPPSINPPSSPSTSIAPRLRPLEGQKEFDNEGPGTYSTLPPLSILRPLTPPLAHPSLALTKRPSLVVANPSIIPSFSFSYGKSRSRVVSVEKTEYYGDEKEKPVIDYDPPPMAQSASRSLRRFFTTNPNSSHSASSVASSSSKKSKRNRSNSNTSSVPQIEDTAPPAPLLITQPQSPGLFTVEEETTQVKRARTSRLVFYTANPSEYTSDVKGPRPNKGKKKASS